VSADLVPQLERVIAAVMEGDLNHAQAELLSGYLVLGEYSGWHNRATWYRRRQDLRELGITPPAYRWRKRAS
jgi:hypothetical protein